MKKKLTIFVVTLALFTLTGCCFPGGLRQDAQPQTPASGPAIYLLNEEDLPDGAKLIEYQEVPHPQGTDYAVSFEMTDGLQVYSKICYWEYSTKKIADLQ